MFISFAKQKDDIQFVWYEIATVVNTGETYKNKKGKIRSLCEIKHGLFKFSKNANLEGEALEFENIIQMDEDETDPYFLNNRQVLIICCIKMRQCKNNNGIFPEILVYANCA